MSEYYIALVFDFLNNKEYNSYYIFNIGIIGIAGSLIVLEEYKEYVSAEMD
jgi:hypothetical protein